MRKGEMLGAMILFATKRHAGQFDKSGKPYILHCFAVMYLMNTDDEEEQCMAIGHDLKEDCGVTDDELYEIGMTTRVVSGITAVTKIPGESLKVSKQRVLASKDGRKVKKADLQHNSDIRRLKGVRPEDIIRTIAYHQFYLEIIAMEQTINE